MRILDRLNRLEQKITARSDCWDLSLLSVSELLELKRLCSSDPAEANKLTKEYIESGKVRYESNGSN